MDDGSGAVTQPMITPTFTATGKTTYQSWDISAGSSDVFIALDPAGVLSPGKQGIWPERYRGAVD